MSYKTGYCPLCSAQIMVQSTNGTWDTYKPNFRQADLIYASGTKVRTTICESCLESPDLSKLHDAITCNQSEACDTKTSDLIKSLGAPVGIELAVKAKQGIKFPNF